MTREEKESILDKHKTIYDGYVTNYSQSNTQPLYVQDFANDKAGLTVNNKGEVTEYKNMRINEMRFDGKSTGLFDEDAQSGSAFHPEETFENEYLSVGAPLDMIGDGEDDLEHGTFGHDDEETISFEDEDENLLNLRVTDDTDLLDLRMDDDIENDKMIIKYIQDEELDEEEIEPIQEQVLKTLDMFKRFKNY
jgi:hypothetical protein